MNSLQGRVKEAVQILKKGGVIVLPTDTVYGLGADAFNSNAVDRIYEIKQRSRHLPLPLLLSDISQITMIAGSVPKIGWFLANRFWPGGLTLVLPKIASLPPYLSRGPTIAVRIPNHPVCLAVIEGLGRPIIGTSANISGTPSCLTVDEVKRQLGDKVDIILDGGRCPGGGESTIVDVTGKVPVILRQGIIAQHEIDNVLGDSVR